MFSFNTLINNQTHHHSYTKERKMVKFSKQFEGQLIPEWKEAFVDYCQLKKDIKRIQLLNNINNQPNNHQMTSSPFSLLRKFSLFGHQQRDHEPIQVNFSFYKIMSIHIF